MNTSWRSIAKIAAGATTLSIAACATTTAPTAQMAVARAADADAAGAASYDAVEIRNAHDRLDAAAAALGANDYERARRYAEEAEADADLAATRTRSAKTQQAVAELRESLRALRAEISRGGA